MKTAEEIWDKHFDGWVMMNERIKKTAIPAMVEYADEVVKNNLVKPDVSGRSEQLKMFENMQYYMEHCIREGYCTPQQWIEKHKHF